MNTTIYAITSKIIKSLDYDLNNHHTKAVLAQLRNSITQPQKYTNKVWELLFMYLPSDFLNHQRDGKLTKEEQAILSTLQLYAIHQQSRKISVNQKENEHVSDAGHFNIQFDGRYLYLNHKASTDQDFINQKILPLKDAQKINEVLKNWLNHLNQNDKYQKTYKTNIGDSFNQYKKSLSNTTAFDNRFNRLVTTNTYNELITNLRNLIRIIKTNNNIKVNYPKLAEDLYQFLNNDQIRNNIKLTWSQAYYLK